jgi:flagellar protein FliS
MTVKFGVNQYRHTSIATANRGQLLIMLYEVAIKNLKKASDAIQKSDVNLKGRAIVKVHDVLNELLNSLNFDVDSVIPRDLERLYNYMIEQLVKANVENSVETIDFIRKILEDLLVSWKLAVEQVNKAQSKTS